MTGRVLISKSVYASVAHRYWNSQWSEAENQKMYGRDASQDGIGSNLRLDLAANTADESDLATTLADLKAKVDHQCLFVRGHELADRPSTLENIVLWLARGIRNDWRHELTLWETEHLGCRIHRGSNVVQMIFKRSNLTLEIAAPVDAQTGIAVERAAVDRAVHAELVKLNQNNDPDCGRWSEKLFASFATRLSGLCVLRVDLGSHESLVVHS